MNKKTFFNHSKIYRNTFKPILYGWSLVLPFLLHACTYDEEPVIDLTNQKVNVIIAQSLYDAFVADKNVGNNSLDPSDPFTIAKAKIEGTFLQIVVMYSGGCENHTFDLYWPESTNQIYPPKFMVYLNHNANGDLCEAAITETLNIDLTANNLNYTHQTIDQLEIIIVNGYDTANQVSTAD